MMHFFKKFNLAMRSTGLWRTVKRKNVSLSVGFAPMFLAGLLSMSGAVFGFQTNLSQPPMPQATSSVQQTKALDANAQQLLDFLEKNRPKKFNKVMASLDRNVSNLERLQKKSSEAYQRGLAAWINLSRVKLYAAQFKVAADDGEAAELRKKIRRLIEENIDARISQLERDLVHSKEKTKRLQKSADELKAKRDATIEKKVANATKRAPNMNKGRNKARAADKAGSKKPSEAEPAAKPKANQKK